MDLKTENSEGRIRELTSASTQPSSSRASEADSPSPGGSSGVMEEGFGPSLNPALARRFISF